MKASILLFLFISVSFLTCRPDTPDLIDRYVGTWDCTASITEGGAGPSRTFRELRVIEISKVSASAVMIVFPDSSNLRMEATLNNRSLAINRQVVNDFYSSGRINGAVTVLGSADLPNQSNRLTLQFTAIGVNSPYTRAVQMTGSKKTN